MYLSLQTWGNHRRGKHELAAVVVTRLNTPNKCGQRGVQPHAVLKFRWDKKSKTSGVQTMFSTSIAPCSFGLQSSRSFIILECSFLWRLWGDDLTQTNSVTRYVSELASPQATEITRSSHSHTMLFSINNEERYKFSSARIPRAWCWDWISGLAELQASIELKS